MKGHKGWIKWVFATVLALAFTIFPAGVVSAQNDEKLMPGTAYVIVDGIKKPLVEGMVVASSIRVGDVGEEKYYVPSIKVTAMGDDNFQYVRVEFQFNEKGEVIASSVKFFQTIPPDVAVPRQSKVQPSQPSGSQNSDQSLLDIDYYTGWAESHTKDLIGLELTTTGCLLDYMTDGSQVTILDDWHWAYSNQEWYSTWSTWDVSSGVYYLYDNLAAKIYTQSTQGFYNNWVPPIPTYQWYINTQKPMYIGYQNGSFFVDAEVSGSFYQGIPPFWTLFSLEGGRSP